MAFLAHPEKSLSRMASDPDISRKQARAGSARVIRLASLFVLVITIISLAAVAYFTDRRIMASRDSVIQSYRVRSEIGDLQLELLRAKADSETNPLIQKKGLPASQQDTLIHQSMRVLRSLTRHDPQQQARLNQLWPLIIDDLSLAENEPGGQRLPQSQQLSRERQEGDRERQISDIIESMKDQEQVVLAQRLAAWDGLQKRNLMMLIMSLIVVSIMLAYNFWLLLTEIAHSKDNEERVRGHADSYRHMSARILELQDSERRRIARELHDSVGQFLAGLKINLSQLEMGGRINAAKLLHETIDLTDYALQEVRTISHLLHPPLLEDLGFLSAARWYVDEYGKRGQVKVSLRIDEPMERLSKEIEIALFRVLQESLTNVYRHSAAKSVDVEIRCRNGYVHLTVADDGKGIPPGVLARFYDGAASGIGLAGMRERLAEFGGNIRVESSSAGAVVEAIIPTRVPTHLRHEEKRGASENAPLIQ